MYDTQDRKLQGSWVESSLVSLAHGLLSLDPHPWSWPWTPVSLLYHLIHSAPTPACPNPGPSLGLLLVQEKRTAREMCVSLHQKCSSVETRNILRHKLAPTPASEGHTCGKCLRHGRGQVETGCCVTGGVPRMWRAQAPRRLAGPVGETGRC